MKATGIRPARNDAMGEREGQPRSIAGHDNGRFAATQGPSTGDPEKCSPMTRFGNPLTAARPDRATTRVAPTTGKDDAGATARVAPAPGGAGMTQGRPQASPLRLGVASTGESERQAARAR